MHVVRPCYSGWAFGFGLYGYSDYYSSYPVYPYPAYDYSAVPYAVAPTTIYNQDVYVNSAQPPVSYSGGYASVMPQQNPVQAEPAAPPQLPPPNGEIANPPQAQPQISERNKQAMQTGMQAFGNGDYEGAARQFLQVAMDDASNVDALLAYAISRFATGDYPVSAIAIRRGVNKYPQVVDSEFDVRSRYGRLDDFQDHLSNLEKRVQERPEDVDAWLTLGFVRHFAGQRELARHTFEAVKRMSDDDAKLADLFINARQPAEEPADEPSAVPVPDEQNDGGPQTSPSNRQMGSLIEEEAIPVVSPGVYSLQPAYELPSP